MNEQFILIFFRKMLILLTFPENIQIKIGEKNYQIQKKKETQKRSCNQNIILNPRQKLCYNFIQYFIKYKKKYDTMK